VIFLDRRYASAGVPKIDRAAQIFRAAARIAIRKSLMWRGRLDARLLQKSPRLVERLSK
jgi:hypothetical protein